MARTKDVILTPEQKEQMEKESFEALKLMEGVNVTRNHSQYDDVENADLKAIVESVALQQASAGREVVDDTPSSTSPKKRIGDKQRKEALGKYQTTFLQVPRINDRKPVFISSDVRDRLDRIVRVLGGRRMSVSGIIENIVRHHLNLYEEDFEAWRKL